MGACSSCYLKPLLTPKQLRLNGINNKLPPEIIQYIFYSQFWEENDNESCSTLRSICSHWNNNFLKMHFHHIEREALEIHDWIVFLKNIFPDDVTCTLFNKYILSDQTDMNAKFLLFIEENLIYVEERINAFKQLYDFSGDQINIKIGDQIFFIQNPDSIIQEDMKSDSLEIQSLIKRSKKYITLAKWRKIRLKALHLSISVLYQLTDEEIEVIKKSIQDSSLNGSKFINTVFDLMEAEKNYRAIKKIDKDSISTIENLILKWSDEGDFKRAKEIVASKTSYNNIRIKLWSLITEKQIEMNDFDGALKTHEMILRLSNNISPTTREKIKLLNFEEKFFLSLLENLIEIRHIDRAKRILSWVRIRRPFSFALKIYYKIAEKQIEMNDFKEAIITMSQIDECKTTQRLSSYLHKLKIELFTKIVKKLLQINDIYGAIKAVDSININSIARLNLTKLIVEKQFSIHDVQGLRKSTKLICNNNDLLEKQGMFDNEALRILFDIAKYQVILNDIVGLNKTNNLIIGFLRKKIVKLNISKNKIGQKKFDLAHHYIKTFYIESIGVFYLLHQKLSKMLISYTLNPQQKNVLINLIDYLSNFCNIKIKKYFEKGKFPMVYQEDSINIKNPKGKEKIPYKESEFEYKIGILCIEVSEEFSNIKMFS